MLNRSKIYISLIAIAILFCILPSISYAATYHIVQPKETLWGISRTYGLTVDELFQLNGLTSDLIFPGQMLLVSKDDVEDSNTDKGNVTNEEAVGENDLAGQIIEFAKTFIGTPYKTAGSSPGGFDCSGFTSYVYKHFNIDLPRVSRDQYNFGKAVSANEAEPGDLVAFAYENGSIFHVGIYMGNGEFIHSSSTKGIEISKTSDIYWGPRLFGFCRVLE